MPIQVQCPGCGRRFQAADQWAGKRAKCPQCSAAISVPRGGPAGAAPATPGDRPAQPPRPAAPPSAEEAAWYVETSDGGEHGPMTRADVERWVVSGRLDSFCRLRHRTWSKWKWAEDLFPQLAPPAGPATPSRQNAVLAGAVPAATRGAATESERRPGFLGNPWGIASVVGSAAVLLAIAAAGLGVGWWVWKSQRALSDAQSQAPLEDLSPPVGPAPASDDEIRAAIEQAAANAAKRLDGEFRTLHSAKTLIDQTQLNVDLIQALAQGDLDAIPDAIPAESKAQSAAPYQSLYDSLYAECLAYLRENVSREEFSQQAVSEAARRWQQEKRSLLEEQVTEELQKYLAPGLSPAPAPGN